MFFAAKVLWSLRLFKLKAKGQAKKKKKTERINLPENVQKWNHSSHSSWVSQIRLWTTRLWFIFWSQKKHKTVDRSRVNSLNIEPNWWHWHKFAHISTISKCMDHSQRNICKNTGNMRCEWQGFSSINLIPFLNKQNSLKKYFLEEKYNLVLSSCEEIALTIWSSGVNRHSFNWGFSML